MQIFSHPLPLVLSLLLAALHFAAPALSGRWEGLLKYINVVLHIALYFLLMLYRIPLEEVALVFLFSLLLYVLSSLLWQSIRLRCEKRAAAEEKEAKK